MNAQENLDSLSRRATDPTAIMWQLQLEDYWSPKMSKVNYKENVFRYRAVIPLQGKVKNSWDHLIRLTITTNRYSGVPLGLGDIELFDMIIPKRYAWGAWSLGPLMSIPTASDQAYGSGVFSLGLAAGISFNNRKMKRWQIDILFEYLKSLIENSNSNNINLISVQPSITYHLNKGFYIETEPVITYSFKNKSIGVPFNLRFGKVIFIRNKKYNAYIEPETTIYNDSQTYTVIGFRFGFRFLFNK